MLAALKPLGTGLSSLLPGAVPSEERFWSAVHLKKVSYWSEHHLTLQPYGNVLFVRKGDMPQRKVFICGT